MIDSEKPKWFDKWVDKEWNLKPNAPEWVKKEYELFNSDINELSYLEISDKEREEKLLKVTKGYQNENKR